MITSYMSYTNSALELLRITTENLPDNITLNSFVYKKEDGVSIRGIADTSSLALDFIDDMRKDPIFESVVPKSSSINQRGQYQFDFDAKFHGAPKR